MKVKIDVEKFVRFIARNAYSELQFVVGSQDVFEHLVEQGVDIALIHKWVSDEAARSEEHDQRRKLVDELERRSKQR